MAADSTRASFATLSPPPAPVLWRSPRYLSWIRTLPCAICGRWPTEAAHTGSRGLGQKAPDFSAIPLCPQCHRLDRASYHASVREFRRRFTELYGYSLEALICRLVACYALKGGDLPAGVSEWVHGQVEPEDLQTLAAERSRR